MKQRASEVAVVIMDLVDMFSESHQEEIDTRHHGDGAKGCTYCAAIKAGQKMLVKLVKEAAVEG